MEETTPAVQEAAPETPATPPWERDGAEFDPARAWALIQDLRADNRALRADKAKHREELATVQAPEPELGPEPVPESEPTVEASPAPDYEAELAAARVENAKIRALAQAGLPLDLADVVAGSTVEQVEASIAALRAAVGTAGSRTIPPNPAQAPVSEPAPAVSWLDIVRGNNH